MGGESVRGSCGLVEGSMLREVGVSSVGNLRRGMSPKWVEVNRK